VAANGRTDERSASKYIHYDLTEQIRRFRTAIWIGDPRIRPSVRLRREQTATNAKALVMGLSQTGYARLSDFE
jgi:hypothetical protein